MKFNKLVKIPISEVADIIGGGTPKTKIESYWNGNIPWLSVVDFNDNNRLVYHTEKTITEDGLENSATKILDIGDIIISARGTVGAIAQLAVPMAFNQSCYGLKAKDNILNDYLYYSLKNIVKEIKSKTHGSVFDTITRNTFDNLEINLLPKDEQKAISATLSCLDDKIELNNRINDNLHQMAQAIFKSWFVDFEPFQDGEFEDSELGMIPKGWGVGSLGDISSISSGKRPRIKEITASSEISIPVIGASSIMAYTNESLYEEPILVTGRVGTHGVVQRFSKKCWPSDNTLVIKSKYYEFVDHCLKGVDFNSINRGSTQPLITQTDLKNIRIIKPLEDVLLTFESLISNLMVLWEENNRLNKTLSETRDTLLPKLMSGEIRVPVEEV